MKLTIALLLLVLAMYVAAMNIAGSVRTILRRRKGIPGGYSSVPLVSIVFGGGAWWLANDTIGWWAMLPAVIDPGTWVLVTLPFLLWERFRRRT